MPSPIAAKLTLNESKGPPVVVKASNPSVPTVVNSASLKLANIPPSP